MLQSTIKNPFTSLRQWLLLTVATVSISYIFSDAALGLFKSPGAILFAAITISLSGALTSFFLNQDVWKNALNALLVAIVVFVSAMYLPVNMLMEKRAEMESRLLSSKFAIQYVSVGFTLLDTNNDSVITDSELDFAFNSNTDADARFSFKYVKEHFTSIGHPADPAYVPKYRIVGKFFMSDRNPADFVVSREDLESYLDWIDERYSHWKSGVHNGL